MFIKLSIFEAAKVICGLLGVKLTEKIKLEIIISPRSIPVILFIVFIRITEISFKKICPNHIQIDTIIGHYHYKYLIILKTFEI